MPFKWKEKQRVLVRTDESLIYGKHNRYVPAVFHSYKGNGKCEVSIGGERTLVKLRLVKAQAVDLDTVKKSVAALEKRLRDMGFKRVQRHVERKQWTSSTWVAGNEHKRWIEVEFFYDGRHRVSHGLDGHMFTAPSRFDDEQGMIKAISFEATRRRDGIDHKVQRYF